MVEMSSTPLLEVIAADIEATMESIREHRWKTELQEGRLRGHFFALTHGYIPAAEAQLLLERFRELTKVLTSVERSESLCDLAQTMLDSLGRQAARQHTLPVSH